MWQEVRTKRDGPGEMVRGDHESPDPLLKTRNPTPSALCIYRSKHSASCIPRAPDPLFNQHRLLTGDQDTFGALDDPWARLDLIDFLGTTSYSTFLLMMGRSQAGKRQCAPVRVSLEICALFSAHNFHEWDGGVGGCGG